MFHGWLSPDTGVTMTPTFSVIVPACDEQFLPQCLDAIDRATQSLGERSK
jgi:hypothetical protein